MVRFLKTNNIYKIIRITGSQDNILGISFGSKDTTEDEIEVIKWDFPTIDKRGIGTSKEKVFYLVNKNQENWHMYWKFSNKLDRSFKK